MPQKLTELTTNPSLTSDDLLYVVNDPAGTSASYKTTVSNIFALYGISDTGLKLSSGNGIKWAATLNDTTRLRVYESSAGILKIDDGSGGSVELLLSGTMSGASSGSSVSVTGLEMSSWANGIHMGVGGNGINCSGGPYLIFKSGNKWNVEDIDANPILAVDAPNKRVGIGTLAPSTAIEVVGTIYTSGAGANLQLGNRDTNSAHDWNLFANSDQSLYLYHASNGLRGSLGAQGRFLVQGTDAGYELKGRNGDLGFMLYANDDSLLRLWSSAASQDRFTFGSDGTFQADKNILADIALGVTSAFSIDSNASNKIVFKNWSGTSLFDYGNTTATTFTINGDLALDADTRAIRFDTGATDLCITPLGSAVTFQTNNGALWAPITCGAVAANGNITANTGSVLASLDIRCGTTGAIYWLNRSVMTSPADGEWKIASNSGTSQLVLNNLGASGTVTSGCVLHCNYFQGAGYLVGTDTAFDHETTSTVRLADLAGTGAAHLHVLGKIEVGSALGSPFNAEVLTLKNANRLYFRDNADNHLGDMGAYGGEFQMLATGSSPLRFQAGGGGTFRVLTDGNTNAQLEATSGTNTIGITGGLYISKLFSTTSQTPSQITSNQNNYAPTAASILRLSTDATRDITGLSISQIDGSRTEVWNVGAQNIVLKHEDTNSTAANRFTNSTAADITLAAGEEASLKYDGTTTRWRVRKLA